MIAYLGLGVWYLWWRTLHTVNLDAMYLSLPLLFADYLGFSFFILFALNLWSRVRHFSPPAQAGLRVDVFIPTYNEPHEVLKPTILSALAMDYPHRTYVLDDGHREEVRLLCEELGVDYLTRQDNEGAKAGNINAALERSNGDLIAIFDADHAPFQSFLTELLGYFRDPNVALVQAPQAYFNLDSFQHSDAGNFETGKPWHEQSVFYDRIMPGKDRMNAAFWCGSSAVLRRSALESVGGVNTLTVTEDMHTGMLLHAAGWKSIYHDRELAAGIAPDDVEPFLGQRLRWAQGAMEILRRDNPLKRKGLSPGQRLSYFTSCVYVIEYLPKTVYLVLPPIALLSGQLPMTEMGWNLLIRFAPYYLLGLLATQRLTRGSNPLWRSEGFFLLKMGVMLRALTLLVWPRKLKFRVTSKSVAGDGRLAALRHIRIQVAAGLLCGGAVIWGAVSWVLGAQWALAGPSLLVTVAWTSANAGLVALMVRSILKRRHRREAHRFPVVIPMAVATSHRTTQSETIDLSTTGVGWKSAPWYAIGQVVELELNAQTPARIRTTAVVTSCRKVEGYFRVGAAFRDMSGDAERLLTLTLFQEVAPGRLVVPQPAQAPELAA